MFSDALNALGKPLSHWLMASVRDFLLSIGWPGMVALFAAAVLVVTLGMRTFRFLESPKGIVTTAMVLLGGLSFLRWNAAPKPTPPASPALAAPLQAPPVARPQLASKVKELPGPILGSKVTDDRPAHKPLPTLKFPPMPVFEPEPVAMPVLPVAPPIHLPPILVVGKPGVHHAPKHTAPKSTTRTQPERPAAVARPVASGAARHSGSGTFPTGSGRQAPHPATQAQRQVPIHQNPWAEYDAFMNNSMQHAMGGMHPGSGMPNHALGMGHPGTTPHHNGHR